MIRNSTIPKVGKVGRRWASWRRQQALVVKKRAGGLCEGCGKDSRPLQVAHLMGRRNIIAEPWASWAGMCAHLCSASPEYGLGCHELVDQRKDAQLRASLLHRARERLQLRIGIDPYAWLGFNPDDQIRTTVRRLEKDGIEP